jgi:hypothetical protein
VEHNDLCGTRSRSRRSCLERIGTLVKRLGKKGKRSRGRQRKVKKEADGPKKSIVPGGHKKNFKKENRETFAASSSLSTVLREGRYRVVQTAYDNNRLLWGMGPYIWTEPYDETP